MVYQHKGNAVDGLLKSYAKDPKEFRLDPNTRFIERNNEYEEIKRLKELFFPYQWNSSSITKPENREELEEKVNELGQLFFQGINPYIRDNDRVSGIIDRTLEEFPDIREKLKKDVEAAHRGDPAARATEPEEKDELALAYTLIIRAYPGITAIGGHRVFHKLYEEGAIAYARELSEGVHSITGIDIHPGAKIGEYFFVDHGTGFVVGETTEIGKWFRGYQGVTLGALSLQDAESKRRKKRHPTIKNEVILYAYANILGEDAVIGEGCVIGGGVWRTESVPAYTRVTQLKPKLELKPNGNRGKEK